MSILAYLSSIAGISMGLSSIPQIYKTLIRKKAKDISKTTHFIISLGALIWLLYGIEINSFPLIISNLIGLLTNAFILFLCYNFID